MPSPGSRRRERHAPQPEPLFGGCLTYLASLATVVVLGVASGGASFAVLAGLLSHGFALVIGVVVGIAVALLVNWLLHRWIGHSITDFLDLLDFA